MTLPADAPPPRLCIVEKRDGEKVSPAERGGLVTGDRIFAVNGHSIIGENHKKVVERIKGNPDRCEMLVISDEGAKWYQEHNIQVTLDLPNIHRVTDTTYRPSNGSPPPSSWYAPTTYSQRFVISSALRLFYSYSLPPRPKMDPSWRDPATWLPYLYTSLLYYLSLIAANLNLPPRITGGDADGETREHVIAETQTERGEVAPSASAADSPPPPPPTLQHLFPSSPHLCVATREVEEEEEEDVTSSPNRFVSTLSFSPSATTFSRRRPPPPPSSSCSIPSSTVSFQHRRTIRTTSFGSDSDSDSDTVSHSNSQISSLFRHNPIRRSQSVIALIPSNSHVLIGIPKLSWRSESIRIRRTRMSEWLDEQQRDVMRQFDEVIRNEEEEEEQQKSMKKKGILKNGSVRSIGSLMVS
uniref:PDZ domain-containing protein n=2 Tax=Caenorhabditis japonica TaxID=281687 RepID=A0A8R1E6H9_CAEJA